MMPAEPEESVEQMWEDYVSELTAILLRHLPDLWHVLHVRPYTLTPDPACQTSGMCCDVRPGH